MQKKDSYSPNLAAPAQVAQHQGYTSQATKELDDLMASLSEFKVSQYNNIGRECERDKARIAIVPLTMLNN